MAAVSPARQWLGRWAGAQVVVEAKLPSPHHSAPKMRVVDKKAYN